VSYWIHKRTIGLGAIFSVMAITNQISRADSSSLIAGSSDAAHLNAAHLNADRINEDSMGPGPFEEISRNQTSDAVLNENTPITRVNSQGTNPRRSHFRWKKTLDLAAASTAISTAISTATSTATNSGIVGPLKEKIQPVGFANRQSIDPLTSKTVSREIRRPPFELVETIFDSIESPLRSLNLKKFQGSWYEIASTKLVKSPNCLCATQSYKVESPVEVKVLKSCRRNIPDADEVKVGRAVVVDPYVPGAWAVSFNEQASFANFFVIEVDPQYEIAVVTGINGLPVAVLSRTPEIPVVKLASIRGVLANQGYDVSSFSETIQQGCWSSVEVSP